MSDVENLFFTDKENALTWLNAFLKEKKSDIQFDIMDLGNINKHFRTLNINDCVLDLQFFYCKILNGVIFITPYKNLVTFELNEGTPFILFEK